MILLVTSDEPFLKSCSSRLAAGGHRIVAARDADDALAQAGRLRPTVILVDAAGTDGAAAERVVRLAESPTIMLLNRRSLDDVLATVDAIDVPTRARS